MDAAWMMIVDDDVYGFFVEDGTNFKTTSPYLEYVTEYIHRNIYEMGKLA